VCENSEKKYYNNLTEYYHTVNRDWQKYDTVQDKKIILYYGTSRQM